jgi:hypothetical protein
MGAQQGHRGPLASPTQDRRPHGQSAGPPRPATAMSIATMTQQQQQQQQANVNNQEPLVLPSTRDIEIAQQQHLPISAIPLRSRSLHSSTPRRTASLREERAEKSERKDNNKLVKKKSQRSIISEMASEYKSLANKWYSGQYDYEDEEDLNEQIRRMRESDAAFYERARSRSQLMSRPGTSIGVLNDEDGRRTKTPTLHGRSQSSGILRHQSSLNDTDHTDSTGTSGSFARGHSRAANRSTLSLAMPSMSGSALVRALSRGKKDKDKDKEKKEKKEKKPGFWSRRESLREGKWSRNEREDDSRAASRAI